MPYQKIKQNIQYAPQPNLFAHDMVKEVQAAYHAVVDEFTSNIIEIPDLLSPRERSQNPAFNLRSPHNESNFQPVSEEILVKKLREQENNIDIIIGNGRITTDTPENIIANELMNFPEVDYDEQSELMLATCRRCGE